MTTHYTTLLQVGTSFIDDAQDEVSGRLRAVSRLLIFKRVLFALISALTIYIGNV